MNKKVLVAAVAAALTAPAAFAQSSVTIGGTVNILWDNVRASGNTGGDVQGGTNNSLKSADRVRDGNGSNIRFTVIEDLGGGTSAFVQVESAVIGNSDTRADNVGNLGASQGPSAGSQVWGNRNSGVGIRSKTAGRFLIGVWDVHYHEHYSIDPSWIPGNSAWSTLSLTQNFGSGFNGGYNAATGTRYSNVIRWDSPVWSGFSLSVAYARPTDGAPINNSVDIRDGKRNRVWNFAPRYESGGLTVQYSYLSDRDANHNATVSLAGTNMFGGATVSAVMKVTSNRLGARYKFANGLGIGALWDSSKLSNSTTVAAASIGIKRNVWAFPLSYDTGNHHVMATWARARDWRGQLGGTGVGSVTPVTLGVAAIGGCTAASGCLGGLNFGADTGANFFSLGYMYNLSQRTNVSVGYARTRNDALVRYDQFANSTGNTAVGADPRSVSLGLRHTF